MNSRFARLSCLLLAFGLWAGCTTNPETGRSQVILVSSEAETQMGLEAFSAIKNQEAVSTNKMAIDRLERIGRRIAGAVGRDLPEAQWEFVVFESEDLNAFALPGGKVGVYTGLMELAETDDELAAVVGHEIAHVTSRHSGERMSHQTLAAGGMLFSEIVMESQDVKEENRNITRAILGVGSTVGMILPYSRLHETEADIIGLKYAAGAGYDPRAAITFWEKMNKASEGQGRPPELLSTHPAPENRIARLRELAPGLMDLYHEKKAAWEAAEFEPVIGQDIE